MSSNKVRPLVVGLPQRKDEIFLSKLVDPESGENFYRPVGGEIEFTEYSHDALVREFDEELDLSIEVGDYLGSIENVIEFGGRTGHELVFVYTVQPLDELWESTQLKGQDDGGITYTGEWKPLDLLDRQEIPVYPDGLLQLLQTETKHVIPRN